MPLPKLTPIRSLTGTVGLLLQLALVGVAVGLACWPLNLLDHWQDLLLHTLPAFSEQGWSPQTVATACAPVVVVPLLLFLQAKAWRGGSGSGIPQTMASIKDPAQADQLMAARPTIQRLVIWSVATLALLPMGREGPVVQVGAAVAHRLRQLWPSLVNRLSSSELMTVAAGAGLAGGFNTPLLGVIFVAEELTGNFGANLVWPGLVIGALAAEVSSLGGQAQFGLGMIRDYVFELSQLGWGLVLGVTAGLLGGLFARLLLEATAWITPRARRHPWSVGLVLGLAIAGMALLTGGSSGGDGEALMSMIIADPQGQHVNLLTLLGRMIGPCLALGASIPGGLIDPAFAIGAVVGKLVGNTAGMGTIGLAMGMAGALAGATQLPVLSVGFALRLAGDQQLLPGVLLAAVIGAYASKVWMRKPVYHALADLMRERS